MHHFFRTKIPKYFRYFVKVLPETWHYFVINRLFSFERNELSKLYCFICFIVNLAAYTGLQ